MSDPLTYMNTFARWNNPPEWNDQWAKALGYACEVIVERDAEIEKLRRILANVPARIALEAKEKAGYGSPVTTLRDVRSRWQ